jgi:hypothetical protein
MLTNFGDLYERHASGLYRFALRMSGDAALAEDLASFRRDSIVQVPATPQSVWSICGQGGSIMSKQAAEHHRKSAEHHEHAARHHKEAAKHHEAGNHEKAAHHAHTAHGHTHHATHHAAEAAKSHTEHHGAK